MIRETRLWEKALKERWNIPEAMRGAIIRELGRIIIDTTASRREKTAAARALIAADAQNIEVEKLNQADEHERRARLVDIAKHLGPGDVARLSAESGIVIEGISEPTDNGRTRVSSSEDVEQESEGERHTDSDSDES